jgi:hypothetical protein
MEVILNRQCATKYNPVETFSKELLKILSVKGRCFMWTDRQTERNEKNNTQFWVSVECA